ncbi:MAG: SDR family NAD(P)-dependent oxidoreductase [Candidatus Obscuribacterales bacterium]|nr:SDR family NAD(P)-dependent oxidoreductase [Candidatus Obscuribacterales bacterium]
MSGQSCEARVTKSGNQIREWCESKIGDQTGRVFVITGATNGIGFESADALAEHGATVVLASRNEERTRTCAEQLKSKHGNQNIIPIRLDLSALRSIHESAEQIKSQFKNIDVLINNAGVMVPPYTLTEDGFELQFGTNHLGHFAFTGLLLPNLMNTPGSRVVTLSSTAHLRGKINFDDLQSKKKYIANLAYAQSKIANLLFAYELQRRLDRANSRTISVAAHPGWSRTGLQVHAVTKAWVRTLFTMFEPIFSQDARAGAQPMLMAATDKLVAGGEYYGPDGFAGSKGNATRVDSNKLSQDADLQKKLWKVSEDLTKVIYPV